MKVFLIMISFLFSASVFANNNIGSYEQKINSGDPCTVFLCMAGKTMGESPSECHGPEKKFFSIISKKHGHFNGGRTSNARNSFLGQCPTADPKIVSKIIRKFGSVRL